MADIDIEKRSSHGLLWAILGVAALGLLLFWLLRGSDTENVSMVDAPATETAAPTTPVEPVAPATPPAVQQYQQACAQPQTGSTMPEAQYTSNCIGLLSSALEGSVSSSQLSTIKPQIDSARAAASQMTTTQDPNTQSELTHEAFDSLASAFESVQGTTSASAVAQLNSTADAVSSTQPLSAQTDTVHRFFSEAGSLLTSMPATAGM